jgi:hypothetical protein
MGWEKDLEHIQKERDVTANGGSDYDKQLRADDKARQDALEKANAQAKIMSKHGTNNVEDTLKAIKNLQSADQKVADAYIKAGNTADALEKTSRVVVNVADATIDGMGNALGPAGRTVRGVYKVAKGVAETTAEHGLNLQNVGAGALKGGLDAASDFTGGKLKVGLQIGSEVASETMSTGGKGLGEGLKKGAVKAIADAIPDAASKGYGGDMTTTYLKNGRVRVAVNNAGKWSGKVVDKGVEVTFQTMKNNKQLVQTGVKTAVNLTNEFGVKPYM